MGGVLAVMVMPSNQRNMNFAYMAGKYPGRIGWLFSPDGWQTPEPWMPFALDNGAFSAWKNGEEWSESDYLEMAEKAIPRKPMWMLLPDVVADRSATLELWARWRDRFRGITLALALQDGMSPDDFHSCDGAKVGFLGGTTEWKWRTLPMWAMELPRLHVGRVNTERQLWMCHQYSTSEGGSIESVDGTGWWHREQMRGLFNYLEQSSNGGRPQMTMDAILGAPPPAAPKEIALVRLACVCKCIASINHKCSCASMRFGRDCAARKAAGLE